MLPPCTKASFTRSHMQSFCAPGAREAGVGKWKPWGEGPDGKAHWHGKHGNLLRERRPEKDRGHADTSLLAEAAGGGQSRGN